MSDKKKMLLWAYGIALHAIVFVFLLFPKLIDDQRWRLGGIGDDRPQAFASELHRYYRAIDAEALTGRVVLLGDSQFHRMDNNLITASSLNFGIGGDTLDNMLSRASDYQSIDEARALVVWGGVNDLVRDQPETVAKKMTLLLSAVSGGADIFVVSLAPINPVRQKHLANSDIEEVNAQFAALCVDRCQYLDVHSLLADETGALASTFDAGDGLHLNGAGYAVVADVINKALGQS